MSESLGLIFVIDDDKLIRHSLGELISSMGLQVKLFGSASELLNCKPPETPACAILDIRLPGIIGLDLQSRLAEAGIRIPVIFLTGQSDIVLSARPMKAPNKSLENFNIRARRLVRSGAYFPSVLFSRTHDIKMLHAKPVVYLYLADGTLGWVLLGLRLN
jgi:DNA-binding NtrC family response regulator